MDQKDWKRLRLERMDLAVSLTETLNELGFMSNLIYMPILIRLRFDLGRFRSEPIHAACLDNEINLNFKATMARIVTIAFDETSAFEDVIKLWQKYLLGLRQLQQTLLAVYHGSRDRNS